jgi:hypothetical protein
MVRQSVGVQARALVLVVMLATGLFACGDDPPRTTVDGREVYVITFPACADQSACAEEYQFGGRSYVPRCAGDIGPKGELYAVDTSEGATLELHVADAPSCVEATDDDDVSALISAFVAARLDGNGAEGCMTDEAVQRYCGPRECTGVDFEADPGPICLYECFGQRVAAFDVSASRRDDGAYVVYLQVDLSGTPTGVTHPHQNEALVVGTAGDGRFAIIDASTSA